MNEYREMVGLDVFASGGNEIVSAAKAFEKEVKDNGVFLPNTMSRKKQIVPPILGAMK